MRNSLPSPDPATLVKEVAKIAEAAAERVMAIYRSTFEVTEKSDGTPLSAADLAAQDAIVSGLRQLSAFPIVSEETGLSPYAERRSWPTFWLVDPLDGTREFVGGNGEFTLNIALIHEHRPILGVVCAPALGLSYSAARGDGALVRRDDGVAERIAVRNAAGPMRVMVSRSHGGQDLPGFLLRLGPHQAIPMGSSLKICLVAEGAADLYPRLGSTSEWDIAAADCILQEAGGTLTDVHGNQVSYNKENILNPWFFAAGSERVREAAVEAFSAAADPYPPSLDTR
jgi:3'(2'), 5'-bisphosphate nucleotidase